MFNILCLFFTAASLFYGISVRLQSALTGHFNVVLELCRKYLAAGILRECQSEACKLWLQSYKLANLQRQVNISVGAVKSRLV